jgi:hypothetical protein
MQLFIFRDIEKHSVLSDGIHLPSLICSWFLCERKYYLLLSFQIFFNFAKFSKVLLLSLYRDSVLHCDKT